MIKWLVGIGIVLALIAFGISRLTPPGMLNLLNSFTPGDSGTKRLAEGEPYGPLARQKLDIWGMAKPHQGTKPVLVFFYGGGWANGARGDYEFAGKSYAAQGFIVVVADYRLVPEVRFPGFLEDAAAAVRWTRDNIARFGGDPGRITLAGHSAGAYLAVMLAVDSGWLTRAGVDPKIVRAAAGLAGPYDFYPFDKPRSIAAMSQWPRPLETQPIVYASAGAPPLWLATGTEDTTVRPYNARNLAAKLSKLGATVEKREYAGLDHEDLMMAVSKPFRHKGPILAESVTFLKAHSRPLSR